MSLSPTLERVVIVVLLGALAYSWNTRPAQQPEEAPTSQEPVLVDGRWIVPGATPVAHSRKVAGAGPDAATSPANGARKAATKGTKNSKKSGGAQQEGETPASIKARAAERTDRLNRAVGNQYARQVETTISMGEELGWTEERLDEVLVILERREKALSTGDEPLMKSAAQNAKAAMREASNQHYADLKALIGDEAFEAWQARIREE